MILILPMLTDLNTYINTERTNRFAGAKLKKTNTEIVAWKAKEQLKPMDKINKITFIFTCKNKKKDKDNLIFQSKFVLDGLVMAGIIKNDGWKDTPDNWHYKFEIGEEEKITVLFK